MKKIIIGIMGSGESATSEALALKANKPVILLNDNAASKLFFKKLATANIFVVNVVEAIAQTGKILANPT
jgi:hypothetical protein